MSSNYQHKKRNSSDSSDPSSSSEVEKCGRGYYDQCRACIVSPPCDYKKKYESSGSDYSCPDFSDLCEDKPRIRCEKKLYSSDDSSDSSESSDQYYDVKLKKCRGCNQACGSCANCRSCACRECSDYSFSSVLNALGSTESETDCPDFKHLASDETRNCSPLFDYCKRTNYFPDNSTKDASCDKKENNLPPHRRQIKRNTKDRKQVVKQSSSSTSSSSSNQQPPSGNKQASSSASSASRGKKFVVTFGPKEGHQWAKYNTNDESIHINGKNGPVLHLYRGSTYFFCVEQPNVSDDSSCEAKHFFFLTDSPSGGIGSQAIQGGFAPVSKGCVCFKVDKCTPRYFFYQSSRQGFEGGLVIVHDK